jgi:hypothetical protein
LAKEGRKTNYLRFIFARVGGDVVNFEVKILRTNHEHNKISRNTTTKNSNNFLIFLMSENVSQKNFE